MPPRLRPGRLVSSAFSWLSPVQSRNLACSQSRSFISITATKSSRPAVLSSECSNRLSFKTIATRSIHSVPRLTDDEEYRLNGIHPVYTPETFQIVWDEYQSHLLERLNELTSGTDLYNKTPHDIAIMTSRNADQAAIFNYASTAANNHFYIESLTHRKVTIPEPLEQAISDEFSHVDLFRESFLATALAVFGNGYVWLVWDSTKRLRILTTYNSGTPYGQAHRRQTVDTNTAWGKLPEKDANGAAIPYTQNLQSITQDTKEKELLIPLLCVNVWQSAWLPQYGINGKEAFLVNWWDSIDWNIVDNRFYLANDRNNTNTRPPTRDFLR